MIESELYKIIKEKAYDYGISKPDIPEYIYNNLKYDLYEWQKDALENFLTFQLIRQKENLYGSIHLMFNMATGTGKTLLMAAAILYYYKQGYRHFIFFVNQNNIIDKTENNFIDTLHTKYLFKNKIVIDDKIIPIKKVESFSDKPQGIEIKFTTIQKLYNDIHLERENQTTLEELNKRDIVMLADEAHHLNTSTKESRYEQQELFFTELTNRANEKDIEKNGWEHTVIQLLLNKNGKVNHNVNVLLEFTATIPSNDSVIKKYNDKLIYKFGLKEFLNAGYTKEINLISSNLEKKERILQALLFHWYRHKIALKYGINNFKPVILFRSKTIDDSIVDYGEFLRLVRNIKGKDFSFLKNINEKIFENQKPTLFEMGKSRTEQVIDFLKNENISYSEITEYIKENFKENINTIITNSKTNKTKIEITTNEQEKLLNSLEDKNNHIRAIFTVDRLTEGWDVLNLFDIVRLYQGQNTGGSTKNTPEATIKEKQLIGRGVRYFPFEYKDKQKNKRKFDDDLNHELRVLEELYYYTYDEESRYISHLKNELRKDGYIRDDKLIKTFKLKEEFEKSEFYNQVKLWYNKQVDNPLRRKTTLDDLKKDLFPLYKIRGLELSEQEINFNNYSDLERLSITQKGLKTIVIKFRNIENHIFRKAVNIKAKQENSFFQFEVLKKELEIDSMEDLKNDDFFGDFDIKIILNNDQKYEDISNDEKLNMVLKFLDNITAEIKSIINPKVGSDFIPIEFKKIFFEPKTKVVKYDEESNRISYELEKEKWYVLDSFYGTSEEKELIKFIENTMGNLKNKFESIYLLRNEEVYKIYDFKNGQGFCPDFLLLLKGKKNVYYQIFIESKGEQLLEHDDWKNEFLSEITRIYKSEHLIDAQNKKYRLIGLPLFNKNYCGDFDEKYNEILNTCD